MRTETRLLHVASTLPLPIDRGLARIKNIDCAEYPCIGTLQLPDPGPQAAQKLHEALNEMIKQNYTGPVALSISCPTTTT